MAKKVSNDEKIGIRIGGRFTSFIRFFYGKTIFFLIFLIFFLTFADCRCIVNVIEYDAPVLKVRF